MALHKDYGMHGVHSNVQLGKQGPYIKHNGDGTISVTGENLSTLARLQASNAIASSDLVTKAQLDEVIGGGGGLSGFSVSLGDISASGDASWTDGAVQTITNSTSISESIDKINEALENVRNEVFVKDIDATANVSSGGSPLSVQLTLNPTGNVNQYDVDWGDGNYSNAITTQYPTHTYTTNVGSPFDVVLTARNTNGSGEGSSATRTKENFISIFTANPTVDFAIYPSTSLASDLITNSDHGDTIYLDNNSTNTSGATVTYSVDWGDGGTSSISSDTVAGGADSSAARLSHQFQTTAETDEAFTVELSLDSHSSADQSLIPMTTTEVHKSYAEHTPSVYLNDIVVNTSATGINESSSGGLQVKVTNSTENTVGSYADFGIQYRYVWGDGQTTTVNVGSGGVGSGDTNQFIYHTYTLSNSDQANGIARDYTGNLEVISQHGSSPFVSPIFSVHVEPDVRTFFDASSVTSNLRASGDAVHTAYKGNDLTGVNRGIITFENTSQNADSYEWYFGDNSANVTVTQASGMPGSTNANITHDYSSVSAGTYTVELRSTGTPDITLQNSTTTHNVVVENVPAAPGGVSSKSLTWSTSSNQGSVSKLASGAVDTISSGFAAGSTLNSSTLRRYDSTTSIQTNTINDAYNSFTGVAQALVDNATDGSKTFSSTTGETGTFDSLVITAEGDANDQISSSTYPKNFYQVFTARVSKNISSLDHGMHSFAITHDSTGTTNKVYALYDNLTSSPTVSIANATLEENSAGTYRYVSGIPYYNAGSPSIKLVGATVSNLTGQAYYDNSAIFQVSDSTNFEGQNSVGIQEGSYNYSQMEGAVNMVDNGIPLANVGVATPYAMGNITIPITNSSVKSVERIKFRARNMNDYGAYTSDHPTKIQVWKQTPSTPSIDEETFHVDNDLGFFYNDDAKRITEFSTAADTPAFSSSTNYYLNHAWSGAETIAGTAEAVVRFGQVEHNTVDYSTGYLPVGPDLNTGRSGAQYITYAFRRTTMANFKFTLTGKISGMFIAAPGTDIDDTSTLNGWLDCSTTYGGAGTPGADTSNGGNGSNGCAFTSGDRIIDGTTYSSEDFVFTLGDQNATNSFGNQILLRFKLESGDYITGLNADLA